MNYYTGQWQYSILLLIMNAGSLHEILVIKTNLVPKSCASWNIRESFSASCTHPEACNCFIPNSRCKWNRIASRSFHLLQGTIHFPNFNSTSRVSTNGKHILKGTRIKKNQSKLASHWKSYASDTNINKYEINASNYTSHTKLKWDLTYKELKIYSTNNETDKYKVKWINHSDRIKKDRQLKFKYKPKGYGHWNS